MCLVESCSAIFVAHHSIHRIFVQFSFPDRYPLQLAKETQHCDTSGCSPFDCLTVFCAPCFGCQELRSLQKEDWDWYGLYQEQKFPGEGSIDPCHMFCVD